MVVGVLRLELLLPENHSLKGKRSVLRTIKARVQNKFNVSIAECDEHDHWQRTILGVSQVGAQQGHVDACLRQVVQFIDALQLAQLGEERVEFLHY
jgi:uncharacterized protein YlxP (DUF503 family)